MKKIIMVNSILSGLSAEKSPLDRADFSVYPATSGKEVLVIHRDKRVDLLIADLEMPDMGGDELCRLIRKENELRGVSVILACNDLPEELERVTLSGANTSITKPIKSDALLEKIEQLLKISTRRGYRVLLRVKVNGTEETVTFFCISHNISVTGMLIETEKLLRQGSWITCAFFLPGSRQIVADGEVVRSVRGADDTYQYGVRFYDLAPGYREDIERFIASFPPGD